MANEITVTGSLSYLNPAIGVSPAIHLEVNAANFAQFTITGKQCEEIEMAVPTTSGGVIIPLGSLATLGFFAFVNCDTTNYVTLMSATTGASGIPIQRIPPGGYVQGYFDPSITAPAIVAHTAVCQVKGLILEI